MPGSRRSTGSSRRSATSVRVPSQEIRFVRSRDGTRIAWARHGRGPVLVRVATWMTHLERDWESPVWRHWLSDLGDRFTVIRYDDRGSGLSDRDPADVSFDAWLADLEAVIAAAGVDRFVLLGISQACAIAAAYAARHADRVRALGIAAPHGDMGLLVPHVLEAGGDGVARRVGMREVGREGVRAGVGHRDRRLSAG